MIEQLYLLSVWGGCVPGEPLPGMLGRGIGFLI
jgi:hypothetical protein